MADPAPDSAAVELTRYLNELGGGRTLDTSEVIGVVYRDLKAIAEGCMRAERPENSLQATALVNEVYLKLFGRRQVEWAGRRHFYAVASKAMRCLLVDQARRRKRRAAAEEPEATIDRAVAAASGITVDLIDLDAALDELAALDARQARVVELKYFGGLTAEETGRVLDISRATVEREWYAAKAWLARRLGGHTS